MNTPHTPTPWAASKQATPDYAPQFGIYSEGQHNDLAIVKGNQAEADTARIVACVNACEGIDPAAIPDLLAAANAVLSKERERLDGHAYLEYRALESAIANATITPV